MDAKAWIDEHEGELVEDICTLVRIPSVSVRCEDPEAPYGKACREALDATLEIGEKYGFSAFNHENYCGSLYWQGDSDKEIGFFGHSDVVPAGTGWSQPPFEPVVRDGLIIGRGAGDNKGSYMTVLYALRYLKEQGYKPRHSMRFFIGCSEETDMSDLEYYVTHYEQPVFSIVPDINFPLCNGEKGLLELDARLEAESRVLLSLRSGVMSNAVPAKAEAVLRLTPEEVKRLEAAGGNPKPTEEKDVYHVSVDGIPAHAAFPEGSESAEVKLAELLLKSEVLDENGKKIMEAAVSFFSDYYGKGLGIEFSDDISGKLTHVGGIASYEAGVFYQNINIRYNITADYDDMIARIKEKMDEKGFVLTRIHNSSPCYTDADEPVVQKLVEICNKTLGIDGKPFVMGGGTYARKLKHAVGYGSGIPGRARLFGTGRGGSHQADEYVEIRNFKKAFLVFAEAIPAMDQMVEME